MKRLGKVAAGVLLCTVLAAGAVEQAKAAVPAQAGQYLAVLGDCMGCHTRPGGKAFAGGAPLQTAFGALTAPNITPDTQTGIGGWSLDDFRRAVTLGIAPGDKRLYPAMPYPNYARMSDKDVAVLFAYMHTVPPVRQAAAPANGLRFPFNIRALMEGWNFLFFRPAAFTPDPAKSPAWNRGAYIVTGPGHCGTCHTPKNFFGADTAGSFSGASLLGWFAPDITADSGRGIGDWSINDAVLYLKTGHNAYSMASGPMAEVIENSTTRMTDGDLGAIALYLKSAPAPAAESPGPAAAGDAQMAAGARAYRDNCQACHGADGKGESVIFPPLAGNPIIRQASAETLARVVLAGTQAVQTKSAPTAPAMPSFAWRLSDDQVAALLTYVRGRWGAAAPVSAATIAGIRKSLAPNN